MSTQLEYVQALERQIATAQEQLDTLKTAKKEALLAAQHQEIEKLEQYLDEANINVKGLSEAADDAWQDLKDSIETLMKTISDRIKHLVGDDESSNS